MGKKFTQYAGKEYQDSGDSTFEWMVKKYKSELSNHTIYFVKTRKKMLL